MHFGNMQMSMEVRLARPALPHCRPPPPLPAYSDANLLCLQLTSSCCTPNLSQGDEATLVLTFDEILAGAAGRKEATTAKRWLDAGAPVQPLPKGLIALDPAGFDMRVAGAQAGKRRRTAAAVPDSPVAGAEVWDGQRDWLNCEACWPALPG